MPPSSKSQAKRPWQAVAREAQEHRDASMKEYATGLPEPLENSMPSNVMDIPSQLLDQNDRQITELLPEDLVVLLASGQLTSVAVTEAFLRRATLAQKLVLFAVYF